MAHPPGPKDSDPAVGFSLGAGDVRCADEECSDSGTALGIEAHIGPKLRADLVLLGDVWYMGHASGNDVANQLLVTGNVQFWPVERFWLRAGAGFARAAVEHRGPVDVSKSAVVPALHAGLGVEVVSNPGFALDAQFLFGQGFHRDDELQQSNLQLGLGFNWY
jgi:hypothetical protein